MAVVNNLKEIRESRGLLQEDLASATGFCTKTIGRVERGERAPSAEFMLRIAAYFNLLVEDVFTLCFFAVIINPAPERMNSVNSHATDVLSPAFGAATF